MQTGARAQNLDLGKLIHGRVLQPLRQARREGEDAAVGQLDDDAIELAIVARRGGARLAEAGGLAAAEGSVDLGISYTGSL